jgi:hypothetical protein
MILVGIMNPTSHRMTSFKSEKEKIDADIVLPLKTEASANRSIRLKEMRIRRLPRTNVWGDLFRRSSSRKTNRETNYKEPLKLLKPQQGKEGNREGEEGHRS